MNFDSPNLFCLKKRDNSKLFSSPTNLRNHLAKFSGSNQVEDMLRMA